MGSAESEMHLNGLAQGLCSPDSRGGILVLPLSGCVMLGRLLYLLSLRFLLCKTETLTMVPSHRAVVQNKK